MKGSIVSAFTNEIVVVIPKASTGMNSLLFLNSVSVFLLLLNFFINHIPRRNSVAKSLTKLPFSGPMGTLINSPNTGSIIMEKSPSFWFL
mgnify:CR=1 FL=1